MREKVKDIPEKFTLERNLIPYLQEESMPELICSLCRHKVNRVDLHRCLQ